MSIRDIGHGESLDTVLEEIDYTGARLSKNKFTKGVKELQGWAPPWVKRWEKTRAGQLAAWRAETVAQAGVDEEDDDLDDTVGDVSNSVLHHEKQDRRSPRYKRYFKRPANEIKGLGLESELTYVRSWPEELKTEPEADLQALGGRMGTHVTAGTAAVEERGTAKSATATHRLRTINPFIDELNSARHTLYGTLVTLGVQKKQPKDWAERFFRKITASKPKKSGSPDAGGKGGDSKLADKEKK